MQVKRTFTSEARRAQIIDAAIETIAEMGLSGASYAQIAQRAELSSTRLISYHFTDRAELMDAVVREVFRTAGEIIRPSATGPAQQLREIIEGNARFFAQYRRHVIAVRDIVNNFRGPDGNRVYGLELHEPEFAVISDLFRAGQAAGEFRRFDPRIMAMTMRHALDGMAGHVADNPDVDVDAYTREMLALFEAGTRPLP